jgi:hypothetical protein
MNKFIPRFLEQTNLNEWLVGVLDAEEAFQLRQAVLVELLDVGGLAGLLAVATFQAEVECRSVWAISCDPSVDDALEELFAV